MMRISYRRLSIQKLGGPARSFVFFALFYLYLWLVVDLRLIYHGGRMITNFPVFYRGWAFFRPFFSCPGGPVEYVCAFLSQLFYIGWAGAIVVTAQAWLICLCTGYILRATGASAVRLLRFVPPVLVLITYTQYTYHFVTATALLTSLLFVCLYIRIARRSKSFCLVSFLVLSVILYYTAGGAYLLFAILCAIYELFFSFRWQVALVCLLSAAVIPYFGGVVIVGVSVVEAFSDLLPFSPRMLFFQPRRRVIIAVHILYLLLPLAVLGLGLWYTFVRNLTPLWNRPGVPEADPAKKKEKDRKKPRRKSSGSDTGILSWSLQNNKLRWSIESLVLFGLAGFAVCFLHNDRRKALLEVDYYGCHKNWPQVLQAARRWPSNDFIVHTANRALYHTGRFSCDMFIYRQHPDILFLTGEKHASSEWNRYDICIELGFINKAESDMADSLERLGERPAILKRLALINMVKGNSRAARIYLGALSKTLFHAGWANDYLARLQSDPNLSTDDQIQHLRHRIVKKDHMNILLALLENSRGSRMAFEYLMAYYLLTRQLDTFIDNLDGMDVFDYSQIPRYYEEAILVYTSLTEKKVDLHGRQISRESIQRFKNFFQMYDSFGEDKQAAFEVLAADYGDSYLLYYIYQRPGTRK
jgi:hypothetical protein